MHLGAPVGPRPSDGTTPEGAPVGPRPSVGTTPKGPRPPTRRRLGWRGGAILAGSSSGAAAAHLALRGPCEVSRPVVPPRAVTPVRSPRRCTCGSTGLPAARGLGPKGKADRVPLPSHPQRPARTASRPLCDLRSSPHSTSARQPAGAWDTNAAACDSRAALAKRCAVACAAEVTTPSEFSPVVPPRGVTPAGMAPSRAEWPSRTASPRQVTPAKSPPGRASLVLQLVAPAKPPSRLAPPPLP